MGEWGVVYPMSPLKINDIPWITFVLIGGALSYISISVGLERAYAGEETLVWLHVLLFIGTIVFVIAAIIAKARVR